MIRFVFITWSFFFSLMSTAFAGEIGSEAVRQYLQLTKAAAQFRQGVSKAASADTSRPIPSSIRSVLSLSEAEIENAMVPVYLDAWGPENAKPILDFIRSDAGNEVIQQSLLAIKGHKPNFSDSTILALEKFVQTPSGAVFFKSRSAIEEKMWHAIRQYASEKPPK